MNRPARIPITWRSRYFLYRHGPRFAYMLLGLGCFLALLANGALYRSVDETNKRQDAAQVAASADRARIEGLIKEREDSSRLGLALLCEIATFIERRAEPPEAPDLVALRTLARARCVGANSRP